ncbi:hypothetical protein ACFL59_08140 [Planctomycetota bacterium]
MTAERFDQTVTALAFRLARLEALAPGAAEASPYLRAAFDAQKHL